MTEPTVCAIMLTADRPALARRAVECFRAQTYPAARLCVFMNGAELEFSLTDSTAQIGMIDARAFHGSSIGGLRNFVPASLTAAPNPPDIFIHWDSDDWSHSSRIAEQVAKLQSSRADVVGYNEMLFWRAGPRLTMRSGEWRWPGEAWLYSNANPSYCLGTSLCYWRKTWERKPFPATSFGEDLQFCMGLERAAVSSVNHPSVATGDVSPRMIARIHAGNTSTGYRREAMEAEARKKNPVWRRVPEWDEHCAAVMQ